MANITFTADKTKTLQLRYLTEFAKLTLQLVCLIVDSTAAFANKILKTLSKSSLDRDFLYYNILTCSIQMSSYVQIGLTITMSSYVQIGLTIKMSSSVQIELTIKMSSSVQIGLTLQMSSSVQIAGITQTGLDWC